MDYLVIDLEMCRVKKLYRKTYKYASEIIQTGLETGSTRSMPGVTLTERRYCVR